MSIIKDQDIIGMVSTTSLESSNPGLTLPARFFVVAQLKLKLFQFWCNFFSVLYPLFRLWALFKGLLPTNRKKAITFPDAEFHAEFYEKKIIWKRSLFQKFARSWKLLVRFGSIWKIGPKLSPGAHPKGQHKFSHSL